MTGYNLAMQDCVFCKIVAGEIPCEKVWEDSDLMAILDASPLVRGQTLVLTKRHEDSYVLGLADELVAKMYVGAAKVARLLDKTLGSFRTAQVMEGLGVRHAHIKLYPLMEGEREGGLIPMGKKATPEHLAQVAEKIREGGDL